MAIQNARTRLVNIRFSQEEFAAIQKATNESNARSISDFCRIAILEAVRMDLRQVQQRLERAMTRIADHVSKTMSL